jgi:exonuclease VII small subunit
LNECYAELEAARKEVRKVNEAKRLKDFKEFLGSI